jgi:hypothetical protein
MDVGHIADYIKHLSCKPKSKTRAQLIGDAYAHTVSVLSLTIYTHNLISNFP